MKENYVGKNGTAECTRNGSNEERAGSQLERKVRDREECEREEIKDRKNAVKRGKDNSGLK